MLPTLSIEGSSSDFMSGATKEEGWQESGLELEIDFEKFKKLELKHADGYKE